MKSLLYTCLPLVIVSPLTAITLTENFNYGASPANSDLVGLGSTLGEFSTAWTGSADRADYQASTNLTYGGTGYNNAGNTATGIGVAQSLEDSNFGVIVSRTLDNDLTGTIWISALIRTNLDATAAVWLGGENGASILHTAGFGIRGTGTTGYTRYASTNYNGSTTDAQGNDLTLGAVTLVLARVTIDYSGAFDRIETWRNPNIVSGITSLGTAQQTYEGSDVFGTAMNRIGVSFNMGDNGVSQIDNIRISNNAPDGLAQVTSIPEPSMFALPAIVLMCAGISRRKRA